MLLAALTSEVERLQQQLRQLDGNGQATSVQTMKCPLSTDKNSAYLCVI